MNGLAAREALPFQATEILRQELLSRYLVDAVAWLVDSPSMGNRRLRAVIADNPWEAAYSVICILKARQHLQRIRKYRDDYDLALENAVSYLLSFVEGDSVSVSWDENPYDSGLATQALALFSEFFPDAALTKRIAEDKTIERANHWLVSYANNWLHDHSIGELDDICVGLRAIIFAMNSPTASITADEGTINIVESVVEELLASAERSDGILHWGETYSTAYILITLQEWLSVFPKSRQRDTVEEAIRFGLNHLENTFEGNWGQPPDTALALQCYLMASANSNLNHDALPEVIYLSFRWLCDKKQFYSNGSIQRSIHYTSLFAEATTIACRIEAIDSRVLDSEISDASDFVLRQIIQRENIERSKLSLLRMQLSRLEKEHESTLSQLEIESLKLYNLRVYTTVAIVIICFSIICLSLGLITLQSQWPYLTFNDWGVIFLFGGLSVAIVRVIIERLRQEL